MREIKFRAWDKTEKHWLDTFDAVFENGIGAKIIENPNSLSREREMRVVLRDEFSLVQYTGLKDKNGKEIYEGDIVLIPDTYEENVYEGRGPVEPYNHLSPVVFEEGAFKFKIVDGADVLSEGTYTWDGIKGDVGVEKLEIIGNIYENPELLTN